jgi:hypothetical protein
VNLLEFNHQHVIALLKLLQNVDPIQLMLQLLVEKLQLNNVNKDVHLALHQLDQDQLELHLHHINLLHLNLHNLLHVIVMDKLLQLVDHHQLMDQLLAEQTFVENAKRNAHLHNQFNLFMQHQFNNLHNQSLFNQHQFNLFMHHQFNNQSLLHQFNLFNQYQFNLFMQHQHNQLEHH